MHSDLALVCIMADDKVGLTENKELIDFNIRRFQDGLLKIFPAPPSKVADGEGAK